MFFVFLFYLQLPKLDVSKFHSSLFAKLGGDGRGLRKLKESVAPPVQKQPARPPIPALRVRDYLPEKLYGPRCPGVDSTLFNTPLLTHIRILIL